MVEQATMFPQAYSADLVPNTTSTGGGARFGFQATYVKVQNDRAAAVFVTFNSTTPSTAGHRTCSGESYEVSAVRMSGCAVASTTTSTGTIVRVLALGG